MQDVPLGAKGSFSIVVGPQHLASQFKDSILPPVFATPMMILAMENAALNAVRDFLDPGETAVGTKVDVSHLAPTPVGCRVRAEAGVTARFVQNCTLSGGGRLEDSMDRLGGHPFGLQGGGKCCQPF